MHGNQRLRELVTFTDTTLLGFRPYIKSAGRVKSRAERIARRTEKRVDFLRKFPPEWLNFRFWRLSMEPQPGEVPLECTVTDLI